ncbi:hypothetical protein ACS0TY_023955 [Phlomoides rotata]
MAYFFDETWNKSVDEVKNGVRVHFLKHFKSLKLPRPSTPRTLFPQRVDVSSNWFLTSQFTKEEVKDAVWSCDSNLSAGPDGFTFGFIKDQWEVLKEGIMFMMHELHKNGRLVKGINPSFIILILKRGCWEINCNEVLIKIPKPQV